jgi:hypothetical protein
MQQQVQALVARCVVCNRVQASLNTPMPHLQPLPIMGLDYRWNVDFAGPLLVTPRHNKSRLSRVRTSALATVSQADDEVVGRRNRRAEGPTTLRPPEEVAVWRMLGPSSKAVRRRRTVAPTVGGQPQSPSAGSHLPPPSIWGHPLSMTPISPF